MAFSTPEFYISDGFKQRRPSEKNLIACYYCIRTLLILHHGNRVSESLTRWLANKLKRRQAKRQFRDALSTSRVCTYKRPLKISHFTYSLIFYVNDAAKFPPDEKLGFYADDFHPFVESRDIKDASTTLTSHLIELSDFFLITVGVFSFRGSVSFFTSHTKKTQF